MLSSILAFPGKLADRFAEATVIGSNAARQLVTWAFDINRLRILAFAEQRYPGLFRELDGGDKRILRAFLDPEAASNTWSLLGGSSGHNTEFEIGLASVVRLASDALGTEAEFDNSFVEHDSGAGEGVERWFFINGIATSRELARRNVEELRALIGKPFTLVHNPTQGLLNDLVESAMQKFTNLNTEPVARAYLEIGNALLDPSVELVAVIAHSQGTIVMGDVLDLIYLSIDTKFFDRTNMNDEDLVAFTRASSGTVKAAEIRDVAERLKNREEVLDKLELYMFANAASRMCYSDPDRRVPHIESFANEHDVVARLGVLARDDFHKEDLIRIDGSLFTSNRYGHLLNAHYLPGFSRGAYRLLGPADPAIQSTGTSLHDAVRGNPCARHPKHHAGSATSKLYSYIAAAHLSEVSQRVPGNTRQRGRQSNGGRAKRPVV